MKLVSLALACLSISFSAFSAELRYSCTSSDPAKGVEGKDVDSLYPIASVSKLMTAHWALVKKGANGRFETRFHLRPAGDGGYDLHIQGSRDPYTDQAMFQFVVGQLNNQGVQRVRKLSFDGGFKFLRDIRGPRAATGYMENGEPYAKRVRFQLEQMLVALNADYEIVRVKAAAVGTKLPAELKLEVAETEFSSRVHAGFKRVFLHKSPPLRVILKEMNRNSNNHAATQIFEALGGAAAYGKFILAKLGLGARDLVFYNGSGNRLDLATPEKKSVYNHATCRAILKVTQALRSEGLKQGFGIERFVSVAGRAAPGQHPGTIGRYLTPKSEGRLVAKTGTVARAISIAGIVKTVKEPLYFAIVYRTDYDASDWENARGRIATDLEELMRTVKIGAPIQFVPEPFVQFDSGSALDSRSTKN